MWCTHPPQRVKSKNSVQVSILISVLTFVSQITFKRAVNGLWGSIPRLSLNLAAGLCSGQSWGLTLLCLTCPQDWGEAVPHKRAAVPRDSRERRSCLDL